MLHFILKLAYIGQFYFSFPQLLTETEISHAVRDQSVTSQALFSLSNPKTSWQAGQLHPNLSWTHYRILMKVEKSEARSFYEIETLKNNWSAREREGQINSLDR